MPSALVVFSRWPNVKGLLETRVKELLTIFVPTVVQYSNVSGNGKWNSGCSEIGISTLVYHKDTRIYLLLFLSLPIISVTTLYLRVLNEIQFLVDSLKTVLMILHYVLRTS